VYSAHKNIRHQSFEVFWYTHHLFIIFMLGLYTHATGCFVRDSVDAYSPFAGEVFWNHCIGYQSWRFTIWVGGLYMAERLWREYRSRRQTEITKVVRHPYSMFRAHWPQFQALTLFCRCHGDPVQKAVDEI